MDYLACLWAFCACLPFSLIFNIRGRAVWISALGGALGWLVFLLLRPIGNEMIRFFFAACAISLYAEVMARVNAMPVTIFQMVALLPLVPGGGIYYTMEYYVLGDTARFIETGLNTLGIAGSLAMGVLLISSLFRIWGTLQLQRIARKTRP